MAQEFAEDLEAALEQFREIAADPGADVIAEKDQMRRSAVVCLPEPVAFTSSSLN
jgi:hypothetical protein